MSLLESYHHLTHHIVPGPQGPSYFIPILLLPTALLIPRIYLSRWQSGLLFLPVMVACTIYSWMEMGGVDVISVNVLLWSFYFLALKDVHGAFGRIFVHGRFDKDQERWSQRQNPSGKPTSTKERPLETMVQYYPSTMQERLPWVGTLLASIRLNNWLTGDRSHDHLQPPTPAFRNRRSLARVALTSFVRGYLVLDFTRTYIRFDPYFTDARIPITSPAPFSQLDVIPPRVLRSVVIGAQAWAVLSQFTYVLCLVPVGLNALGWWADEWSPHTWAPLYGNPDVVLLNGVRGFWSQYWHQSMRVMTTAPGYAVADGLGLRRGGIGRYAVITTVAFFLSGIVHMGLVPPAPMYAITDTNSIRLTIASFFWLQPAGILAEVLIGRLTVSILPTTWLESRTALLCRCVANALFVSAWAVFCLPLLGDLARQIGYWEVWPIPISLCHGLIGKGFVVIFD